jgi:hypothetical protein
MFQNSIRDEESQVINRKIISQREAHELRRRVVELENIEDRRRNAWADSYPGGANIATLCTTIDVRAAVHTARLLKHAVVVTLSSDGSLKLYALPLGSRA